ncbi:MAG TPA: hypothetical protein VFV67_28160 [Actinophytocola sp.]|uniref:hypothetical protein n=1 Tax=Actinophytocola sp. TaxID=1872138 RepID=UPI002DB7BF92|nr:hypothetical protein [Actinophytocola sp.]HEU5474538.1 hypothetical protein [Actinophytocola sp.]
MRSLVVRRGRWRVLVGRARECVPPILLLLAIFLPGTGMVLGAAESGPIALVGVGAITLPLWVCLPLALRDCRHDVATAWRRAGEPLLVVDEMGVWCAGDADPLPWAEIGRVTLSRESVVFEGLTEGGVGRTVTGLRRGRDAAIREVVGHWMPEEISATGSPPAPLPG